MIDDLELNVAAARLSGMKGIQFKSVPQLWSEFQVRDLL